MGRLFTPITPVPNPLPLEAILGGSFGPSAETFHTLALLGHVVLRLLFSVVLFMEHPFDDAGLLAARVNADQSEERLAAMFVESGILAEVLPHQHWKPHDTGVDLGTAACMQKALIAACVHEPGGNFYCAVR